MNLAGTETVPSVKFGRLLKSPSAKVFLSATLFAGIIVLLAANYDLSEFTADIHELTAGTIVLVCVSLIANALFAAVRFKAIATDMGHSLSLRRAMATVSAGNLAGALFFQIAGQLIARGFMMGRGGIPFASVIVITFYERVVAAILSALVAVGGAYFVFGQIYVNQDTGGATLIKLMIGLVVATLTAALIGYGRIAVRQIAPLLSEHFVKSLLRVSILTLCVQLPMMVAYVTLANALSPDTELPGLIAASAIVMFAASVPISLAGWGVREMSAVAALGAIGVSAHAAFTTAIIIGVGSLAAMGIVAALSLPGAAKQVAASEPQGSIASIDYTQALGWALPLAAATLVLFQVYVPVGSGLLNVNLADPVALVGASLFILAAIRSRRMPVWREPGINNAVFFATAILAISLLIGIANFGVTQWAWVNRFLGWFILLSYAATGALIVKEGGGEAFKTLLLTFSGATGAVAGLELTLMLTQSAGLNLGMSAFNLEGFSQNHNFFAFQLLMATCTTVAFANGRILRVVLLSVFVSAFWFAGSRSGWISAALVFTVALYLRSVALREIAIAIGAAVALALIVALPQYDFSHLSSSIGHVSSATGHGSLAAVTNFLTSGISKTAPTVIPTEASTRERLVTMIGGLKMFLEHPLFGAGLGAFRNQLILATSGIPLVIHSTYIWLLAELGIVGFLIFAVPALFVFCREWSVAGKDKAATVVVLCLVAFASMSGPADMLYQRTFWIIIGAALAVARPLTVTSRSRSESAGLGRKAG